MDFNFRVWNANTDSDDVGWARPDVDQPLEPYQRMAGMLTELRRAGYGGIKLPPSTQGNAGIFSSGYDKKDDYELDGTAYGNGEQLRQLSAIAHAHGMRVYGDLVLHQYFGGNRGNYPYSRFPKFPSCFGIDTTPGGVEIDPVPDMEGNFAFGDRAAYQHSTPAGYMHAGAIAAANWLAETVDFDGFRIDEAKGTYAPLIWDLLHAPGKLSEMEGIAEYFKGDPNALANYVWGYNQGRLSVLDFTFKSNITQVCNSGSGAWMGWLANNFAYCQRDAYHAVTFVESADSDNSPGQQVIWNKILGYAVMLTFPGYPMVYYRDWQVGPNCYGLKHQINNLVWIHENLAQGDMVVRLGNDQHVFAHERLGWGDAPGCVCLFNNNLDNGHTRTVQTHFPPNTPLHEYSGNASVNDIWTDGQGRVTITVPKNNNGAGYVIYAPELPNGGRPFSWTPRPTTQVIEGAHDLKKTPAAKNGNTRVARIDIHPNTAVQLNLSADQTGWTAASELEFLLADDHGTVVLQHTLKHGIEEAGVHTTIAGGGWHTIVLTGINLPDAGSGYFVTAEYIAPQSPSL